jgi:GNAT superfamily N-acetyltransferase
MPFYMDLKTATEEVVKQYLPELEKRAGLEAGKLKAAVTGEASCTSTEGDFVKVHFTYTAWSEFLLREVERDFAYFNLHRMPGCCGVVVSYHASVLPLFQGKGLGQLLMRMRFAAAYRGGFTLMQCTTTKQNKRECHILGKLGWKQTEEFINRRTSNTVLVYTRQLHEEDDKEEAVLGRAGEEVRASDVPARGDSQPDGRNQQAGRGAEEDSEAVPAGTSQAPGRAV